MTTQTEFQSVVERLHKVERQYRRLKVAGILVLALVGGVVLSCAAGPRSRTLKTVEAQRPVVRNEDAMLHAKLRVFEDGATSIRFLSEAEILALLPEGAKLADDIPLATPARADGQEKEQFVHYADVDGDGENEIVVAYYWSPALEEAPETEGEKAWAQHRAHSLRARIRVLDWDGTGYVVQWDNGGFGERFQAIPAPGRGRPVPEKHRPYAVNAFDVRDITGDGTAEILATVPYYRTRSFRAWTWDGKGFRLIANIQMYVRIDDTDNDGVFEIIVDRGRHGVALEAPIVFRWDPKSLSYRSEEPESS